ncbi:transcription factor WEREWOLF, putative [Entamoeba invadens IP1]|uniref:Transcription factor WEREWOLF, putative n=1 Tax=Entamoeba invadens IP1 TaxID=370355 RepID=A0A0A1UH22_ENTIV|nr:transcription factor WEREWOLF, putative [Entamoeba invadens IP1]ELP94440.1 transcription factor WEREWOLF, putative [Entamoeba invadens IP1]|eukprot:XP_004261211.1 transcription factor WEREWOLF, putative [Entamoeba invadens IP1]
MEFSVKAPLISKHKKFVNMWKKAEDSLLLEAVETFGLNNWKSVCRKIPGRTRKQCRERYLNHLSNGIVQKRPWTVTEDIFILKAVNQYGRKWSVICTMIQGRTANNIKNRFFGHLKRLNITEEMLEETLKNMKAESVFTPVASSLYEVVSPSITDSI